MVRSKIDSIQDYRVRDFLDQIIWGKRLGNFGFSIKETENQIILSTRIGEKTFSK